MHLPRYCLAYISYASTEYSGSFVKKGIKMTTLLSIYF